MVGSLGTLTLNHSTVSGNNAAGFGGGIHARTDTVLALNDSTVSGNHAGRGGGISGGIPGHGGGHGISVVVTNSTINGNTATHLGGGMELHVHATVTNSTISGNTAHFGGGVWVQNPFSSTDSTLTLSDSTVTGNTATGAGGGIASGFGHLTLARSIVSGNSAPTGREIIHYRYCFPEYCVGELLADDFNLVGHSGDAGAIRKEKEYSYVYQYFRDFPLTLGGTDIVPDQPLPEILGPLANNGRPTLTHALVAGSPALDAIPATDAACAGTDQRGVTRPQGFACDIGAFEREPSPAGFAFNGFFTPVSNHQVNGVKAGQAIPVRFSLGGDRGLDIFDGGYPATLQVACALSSGTSQISDTSNAGNSTLSYDAANDTYTYVWKTDKGWSNSCRQLQLRFRDGSTAEAEFRFTK